MKYDFDTVHNRRNTGSLKWNVGENEIPMWVADMDFETAPEVKEALVARAAHGIYGYTEPSDAWYEAYISWWQRRHGMTMEKKALLFCTGVVPAISSIVRKFTTPNENVLVQTPVYNCFFSSVVNNGCRVQENPLLYRDGKYGIDFADLEKKLSDPQTSLMILCNPHNPVGKIWDRETLGKIGALCEKYHVTVISDEIHCDITVPGRSYVPFASVNDTCKRISITCLAPTKTFNLAGVQTAAIYVPDPFLRHKVWRGINTDEVAEPNVFAETAAVAAFNKGEEWAEEMNEYVAGNRRIAAEFLAENLPEVHLVEGEATYLLWIDVQAVGKSREIKEFLREKAGVYVSAGIAYGGEGFLRMNIACPRATLLEGLKRLASGIRAYLNK